MREVSHGLSLCISILAEEKVHMYVVYNVPYACMDDHKQHIAYRTWQEI